MINLEDDIDLGTNLVWQLQTLHLQKKPIWIHRGGESCEQSHVRDVQNLQEFNYGKVHKSTKNVHNINKIGTKDQKIK